MSCSIFTTAESAACRRLIELALEEDLGRAGDLTSQALIPADLQGQAVFIARSPGVLAGLQTVDLVCARVDRHVVCEPFVEDGSHLDANCRLAILRGPVRAILAVERTALNFLQHLSGIATATRRYVDAVAGLPARILDTRKTTPGYRLLEKHAVRCGGGHNHRMGLFDDILIKDNHLASLGADPDGIATILEKVRSKVGAGVAIEIEVDSLEQFKRALTGKPNIILLDNMPLGEMREAVRRRNAAAPEVQLEASGGVNLITVRSIAETGVDRISVGALTHSAPALDIALDYSKT
ncbi:MAG: carboxylating nicotinate-nucleotide diphosphorylase [Gemmataceae bacterium]